MILDTINESKKHFGELSVVRGNTHTFLGMNIYIKDTMITRVFSLVILSLVKL